MSRTPKRRADLDTESSTPPTARAARAVVYLRVSTPSQVNTDFNPEGISIPAQREAVQRKAAELGAEIVREFVEPGKTATSIERRPVFQEMVSWIKDQGDIDYLVVYHFNRVFRNSVDAGITKRDLSKVNTRIVSTILDMGEGPESAMVETIMHAVDQYQSEASAADIRYKMSQKVKNGGSVGKAPLGYLNVREQKPGGGEVRTVAVDPERGHFIKLAFELYSTGEYTLQGLVDELTNRGLKGRGGRYPAGPITDTKMATILRDRYYLGYVKYKGEEYQGRHTPLIELPLFQKVQEVLKERSNVDERRRTHQNYLRGMLWCGACHSKGHEYRMVFSKANGNGGTYLYYFCTGKQAEVYIERHAPVDVLETAVEEYLRKCRFEPNFIETVSKIVEGILTDGQRSIRMRHDQLKGELRKLEVQEENLLDLAADGQLPTGKIRERLHDLGLKRDLLTAELEKVEVDLRPGAKLIALALELMAEPDALYHRVDDPHRRLILQTFFERLYVQNDEITGGVPIEPFSDLLALRDQFRADQGAETTNPRDLAVPGIDSGSLVASQNADRVVLGLNSATMVELRGFEPLASSMPWKRSTN